MGTIFRAQRWRELRDHPKALGISEPVPLGSRHLRRRSGIVKQPRTGYVFPMVEAVLAARVPRSKPKGGIMIRHLSALILVLAASTALAADGSVFGHVVVNGKPLNEGRIIFHLNGGQF